MRKTGYAIAGFSIIWDTTKIRMINIETTVEGRIIRARARFSSVLRALSTFISCMPHLAASSLVSVPRFGA